MKKLLSFLIVVACAAAVSGQTKKPGAKPEIPAKASALDKTTFENYIRHLQVWDRSINIQVGDPKPTRPQAIRILLRERFDQG